MTQLQCQPSTPRVPNPGPPGSPLLTAYLREDRLLKPLLPSPKFPFSLVKHKGTALARRGERLSRGAWGSAYAHALWLPSGRALRPRVSFRKAPLIGPATRATPTTPDGQLLTCLVSFRGLALKMRGGAGGFLRMPPDQVWRLFGKYWNCVPPPQTPKFLA